MPGGAQLSVTDMRNSVRCRVDYVTTGEHLTLGEMELHVRNVSNQGFMVVGARGMERGHRVIIRLPAVGRIEGCCSWTLEDRAGFQFERIIRPADFAEMTDAMQPKTRRQRSS
jgi:hypothetical protein